jgi:hypothetical protein
MKKIKLIFLSVVTIAGVGGALATGHKTLKPGAVTYYAMGAPNNYVWVTINQRSGHCTSESTSASCTVISADGSNPGANSHPNTSNFTYTHNSSLYE